MIQAAGARSAEEALMLAACGVTHVGLPLRLDHHAPDVTEEQAQGIVTALDGRCRTVLITYQTDAADTLLLCRFLGVSGVQLHGRMPVSEVRRLRGAAPSLFVIKSLVIGRVAEDELMAEAREHAPVVDAFLTDTFDPGTGASGATGKAHDWDISRRLARELPRPLILAGGLNPGNVGAAIAAVRPAGVDAHTGLEDARGAKDEAKVRRFVAEARAAWAEIAASDGHGEASGACQSL
jgi:phosphoribosylanthranilate isomerase